MPRQYEPLPGDDLITHPAASRRNHRGRAIPPQSRSALPESSIRTFAALSSTTRASTATEGESVCAVFQRSSEVSIRSLPYLCGRVDQPLLER